MAPLTARILAAMLLPGAIRVTSSGLIRFSIQVNPRGLIRFRIFRAASVPLGGEEGTLVEVRDLTRIIRWTER